MRESHSQRTAEIAHGTNLTQPKTTNLTQPSNQLVLSADTTKKNPLRHMQFNVFNVYSVNLRCIYLTNGCISEYFLLDLRDWPPRTTSPIMMRRRCKRLGEMYLSTSECIYYPRWPNNSKEKSQHLNAVSCFMLWQALARHTPIF